MKTKTNTKLNAMLSATLATAMFVALSTSQVAMADESVLDLTQTYLAGEKVEEATRINYSIERNDVAQGYRSEAHSSHNSDDVFSLTQSYFQGK